MSETENTKVAKVKVTRVFSGPLMRQDIRSNLALTIIVILIMAMMSVVISFAGHMIGGITEAQDYTDAQTDFYSYLYVMASYNEMAGTELSYEDYESSDDHTMYETVFDMMNAQTGMDLSTEGFETSVAALSESDIEISTYVTQFEYVYALDSVEGCFSGDSLDMNDMMANMLEMMGLSMDMMESMSEMDSSAMLNQMYYTIMIILPVLLFIIVAGNSLVVNQVDRGSMAYVLSTPTKRNAVVITQMLYMIILPLIMVGITCLVRMGAMYGFDGAVDVPQTLAMYGGMYLLVEAMASICYFASCFFNLNRNAMAVGAGLNIWFFLASLLGMFGSEDLVSMGMGAEALDTFNHLTIIGLFDINALGTVGSEAVDTSFVWKLCVLAAIAVVFYIAGAIRFKRKDLPL